MASSLEVAGAMALAGTLSNCEYLQCIFLAPLLEETSATLCHLNKRDAGVPIGCLRRHFDEGGKGARKYSRVLATTISRSTA